MAPCMNISMNIALPTQARQGVGVSEWNAATGYPTWTSSRSRGETPLGRRRFGSAGREMQPQVGFGAPRSLVAWVGAVPNQRLGRDVDVARPRYGPVPHGKAPEDRCIPGDRLEHRPSEEVRDVAFDQGPVRQRQADTATLEWLGERDLQHVHGY